ncbi:MAG: molybdopterin molybdotransferase MoeA [Thermoplasmatales archaeon]|nr:molybdopterin molybdotransferase MoeA [Thermoplasmatales archaeon]MCW6170625.1 molybdopterin molybdotransferase MoeA [Thermoplasmatales archaeon]
MQFQMDFKTLVRYDIVLERIDQLEIQKRSITLGVKESVGRFVVEDIASPSTFPPHNRSAVDGFAVKFENALSASRNNPASLRVVGTINADTTPNFNLQGTECARVFTGAMIPEGSDAVVMQEDTEAIDDHVLVFKQVRKFQNIMRAGEDLRKGDIILHAGEKIMPWHLAAMIEAGIEDVKVLDTSVGILSTGDELVSGRINNSTAPMLSSLIHGLGMSTNFHGNVVDSKEKIIDALKSMREDVIIVTGGSGPSSVDLMHDIVSENGRIIFHGVKIKPGRTTGLGLFNEKPIFIISGLPVAALVAFDYIIHPALASWFGIESSSSREVKAILTRSIYNNDGVMMFVRVRLFKENDKLYADPLRTTGSGVISSVIRANGYLIVKDNLEGYKDGDEVNIKLIGDYNENIS